MVRSGRPDLVGRGSDQPNASAELRIVPYPCPRNASELPSRALDARSLLTVAEPFFRDEHE
jgi:hypothetical protein